MPNSNIISCYKNSAIISHNVIVNLQVLNDKLKCLSVFYLLNTFVVFRYHPPRLKQTTFNTVDIIITGPGPGK